MPKVTLLVVESVEDDDVYALEPSLGDGVSNATREWSEARVFQSKEEAAEFCKHSRIPFVPVEISLNLDYLQ